MIKNFIKTHFTFKKEHLEIIENRTTGQSRRRFYGRQTELFTRDGEVSEFRYFAPEEMPKSIFLKLKVKNAKLIFNF